MIPVKNHFKHDHVKLYSYLFTPASRTEESVFANVRVDFRGTFWTETTTIKKDTNALNFIGSSLMPRRLFKVLLTLKGVGINQGEAVL